MDPTFWRQKWESNQLGFHKSEANPALVNHLKKLALPKGSRIFLPLCGKTLDIGWLLSQGYRVVGAELVDLAIQQLFDELRVDPTISPSGKLTLYQAHDIDIFVGDIFDVSPENLGPVDAIYDRGALVALPKEIQRRYTAHLRDITQQAPQLLVTLEYDQALMAGPPFSISSEEVHQHYGATYDISLLASGDVVGGLGEGHAAKQHIWRLQKN